MSTRCNVGIYKKIDQRLKKPSVLLYKHSDGYPERMEPLLVDFCNKFDKTRGLDDTEYCAAQCLYHMMQKDGRNGVDGFGICGNLIQHVDISFYYAIYPDRLEIYDNKYKLIKTIDFKSK